jgi:hypothetical protein
VRDLQWELQVDRDMLDCWAGVEDGLSSVRYGPAGRRLKERLLLFCSTHVDFIQWSNCPTVCFSSSGRHCLPLGSNHPGVQLQPAMIPSGGQKS